MNERDTNDQYWREYNNLQHIKHGLLKRYLGGWYAILSKYHGKVVYLETHAGCGRHKGGQAGSPIVALETLLTHHQRKRILESSEVFFLLAENREENVLKLREEIEKLGPLPPQITVKIAHEDFEKVLDKLIKTIEEPGFQLAPAFIFVDPYSYRLPVEKLARLLAQGQCDMVISFMWRYVNLALHNPTGHENYLDALFGPSGWNDLVNIGESGRRCEEAISRIVHKLNASQFFSMKMLDKTGTIKYVLLHVANQQKARELMKESAWALAPEGTFEVRQSDDPNQNYLITPIPDLQPLTRMVWRKYRGRTVKVHDTYPLIHGSIYLKKHYHHLLRQWRKDGSCVFTDYPGRFGFEKNPTVEFRNAPI